MAMMKDLPFLEKPREKGLHHGIRSLSSTELLAIMLRNGVRGNSVLDLSEKILKEAGGISGISKMSIAELTRFKGIGSAKAMELMAAFELARRVAFEHVQSGCQLDQPEKLVEWLQREIGQSMQEQFLVVYLDTQLCFLAYRTLFQGTLDATDVFPREIFKEAILHNSRNIILVHNHPSGSILPSKQDIVLTKRIVYLGKMMEIEIVDHLIIAAKGFFSFSREGILEDDMEN